MTQHPELPGMPAEAPAPRKGSAAWYRAESARFVALSRQHNGLTIPLFAAALLGISRQRVHQLMNTGALARYDIMGKVWLSVDEVEWFASLERGGGFRYGSDSSFAA